jgi:uncharacterized membrane protein
MKELESLLSDIPLEEREEALGYYNGYFEDAGEEQEEEIIKELGSPNRIAAIIKADLNSNAADRENRGYFTENGYQDTIYNDEKYEIVGAGRKEAGNKQANSSNNNNSGNTYNANGNNANTNNTNTNNYGSSQGPQYNQGTAQDADRAAQQRTRNTNIALIILICIVGSPIIMSVLGVAFGFVMALVGIIFGFGVAGIAMMFSGVALFIAGLIKIGVPFVGLLLCGSGLIVLGLGMLFTIACVQLCKNVLPAMVRGIVNLCRKPFQNRSVAA